MLPPEELPFMFPVEDLSFKGLVVAASRKAGEVVVSSPLGVLEPLRLGAVPEPLMLPPEELPFMFPVEDLSFKGLVVAASRKAGEVVVSSPLGVPEPLRLGVVPAAPVEVPAVVVLLSEPCFMPASPAWRAGAKTRQMAAARAVALNFIAMLLSNIEGGPNRFGVRLNLS
ncbi:MAG: hypothetical protein H0U56_07650 [Methylibium sp.]|nr:hypothetical protein [Methylibium sp.]